jgi:stage V sporulation protein SpoVS
LDEHAFAVRFVIRYSEAAVDILAIGGLAVEQQIKAFDEQRCRQADQQINQIGGFDLEHDV